MEAFALSPDAPRVPLPQRLLSDDRLLRLVAAGNPQAFGAVYARYHAPLYAYCRSIVRDPDDAKDALQNTMVKALAALERGQDRELALKPWLFRIAHNESVSLLRRRKPSEPLTDALAPPVAGVEMQAVARERLAQLVEDLQELPERQRSALIMREVNGLSYEDIAAALGISPGAARQTVFEARTALAEYGEGREVACESIRRSISDGDGRAMRARRVRAHLRSCDACRDFHSALKVRRRELHLLAPGLSGGTAMALLQGVLGAGAAGGGAAVTGGAGLLGGSASAVLASGAAKSVVALVAVGAVGAGAVHIAAPSHHRARRAAGDGGVSASAASAGAPAVAAARSVGAEAPAGTTALAGTGFSAIPRVDGHGRHRHVTVLGHPGLGLGQPGAALFGDDGGGRGGHGAGVLPPPQAVGPHHHGYGSPWAGDDPNVAGGPNGAAGPGGYSGWAAGGHGGPGHHGAPPADPGDGSADPVATAGNPTTVDDAGGDAPAASPWQPSHRGGGGWGGGHHGGGDQGGGSVGGGTGGQVGGGYVGQGGGGYDGGGSDGGGYNSDGSDDGAGGDGSGDGITPGGDAGAGAGTSGSGGYGGGYHSWGGGAPTGGDASDGPDGAGA